MRSSAAGIVETPPRGWKRFARGGRVDLRGHERGLGSGPESWRLRPLPRAGRFLMVSSSLNGVGLVAASGGIGSRSARVHHRRSSRNKGVCKLLKRGMDHRAQGCRPDDVRCMICDTPSPRWAAGPRGEPPYHGRLLGHRAPSQHDVPLCALARDTVAGINEEIGRRHGGAIETHEKKAQDANVVKMRTPASAKSAATAAAGGAVIDHGRPKKPQENEMDAGRQSTQDVPSSVSGRFTDRLVR